MGDAELSCAHTLEDAGHLIVHNTKVPLFFLGPRSGNGNPGSCLVGGVACEEATKATELAGAVLWVVDKRVLMWASWASMQEQ